MSLADGGLSWRDVAPGTLWRLLELGFDLTSKLEQPPAAAHAADAAHSPTQILAWLFGQLLQNRILGGLSQRYLETVRTLQTVRGSALLVQSYRSGLAQQGKLRCRFEELSVDRPRNRQFKCAANLLLRRLATEQVEQGPMGDRLQWCVRQMGGIGDVMPDAAGLSADTMPRHELEDVQVVATARLVLELFSGSQHGGAEQIVDFDPDNRLMRRIFERAVLRFLEMNLPHSLWTVSGQEFCAWATGVTEASEFLPAMKPDVVLRRRDGSQTVIVETKFTRHVVARTDLGEPALPKLHSSHLYQVFSYARSQQWQGKIDAVLVYPRTDDDGNDDIAFQSGGIGIRVVTLDLRDPDAWTTVVATLSNLVTVPQNASAACA